MENNKVNCIINNAIKYKFNESIIKANSISYGEVPYGVIRVTEIFGADVSWTLGPFKVVDIYKYFEEDIVNEILDNLLRRNNTWEYCQQHKHLTLWMRDETCGVVHEVMSSFLECTGIEWSIFFENCMSKMGSEALLSNDLYHNIIGGYFERISKRFFRIDVKKTKYTTPKNAGVLTITFPDGTRMPISSDFFTGHQFFNELTRESITENFFNDIERNLAKLLCS